MWKEGFNAIEMDRSGCNAYKIPTEGSGSDSSTKFLTKTSGERWMLLVVLPGWPLGCWGMCLSHQKNHLC